MPKTASTFAGEAYLYVEGERFIIAYSMPNEEPCLQTSCTEAQME